MGSARLLSAGATRGWRSTGQLWLLDDGLLHAVTDLAASVQELRGEPSAGSGTVVAPAEQVLAEAARDRRNLWLSRGAVASAVLRGGLEVDSLRLRLGDGRRLRLRWPRRDGAYQPLKQALESWVGSGLALAGRRTPPRPPRTRPPVRALLVANLLPAIVLVALYAGWLDPLLGTGSGRAARGCDDLARITQGWDDTPEPGAAPHRLASLRTQTAVDRALRPFLLDTVAEGTYVHTHEHFWDLDGHAEMQHNPAARELAARHGFVRQVSRQWTDDDGDHVAHIITQVSSARNAESLNVNIARYSCRFAEEVWPAALGRSQRGGIGQLVLYRGGGVTAQVSWTRDGRRHLLEVHDRGGDPDRDLLERLVARAYPRDDAADVVGAG